MLELLRTGQVSWMQRWKPQPDSRSVKIAVSRHPFNGIAQVIGLVFSNNILFVF
jgi:hypothetical protein